MRQDRAARSYAVPVRGSIVGHNYGDGTERDLSVGAGSGAVFFGISDATDLVAPPPVIGLPVFFPKRINALRILKPHFGELIQCYVDLNMRVASADSSLEMKLAIGRLQGTIDRVTNYDQQFIDDSWRLIRGHDEPLKPVGGVISAELLDLLPALPKYGQDGYDQDMFVLLVVFNRQPSIASPYVFNFLNIHTSVTGAI